MATETPATVFDWWSGRAVDEVLRMDGLARGEQVVLLESHRRGSLDAVLGSVRDMRIEDGQLIGRAYFADDPDVERHWNKVKQGHITDFSVGYRVDKYKTIPRGKTKKINGTEYSAAERDLRVTTAWTLRELSLVDIGADAEAKVRQSDDERTAERQELKNMDKRLLEYLRSIGLDADATDEQAWAFYGQLDGVQRKEADVVRFGEREEKNEIDSDAVRSDAVKAERDRQRQIRGLVVDGVPADLVERAIDEGWAVDRASAAFLGALRDARPEPAGRVEVGRSGAENLTDTLSDAICMRAGIETDSARRSDAERFAGIGLQDAARLVLQAEGRHVPTNKDELFRAAVSTSSLPTLLGTSATKSLAKGYQDAASTSATWTASRDVSDFKTYSDIRVSGLSKVTEVGPGGKLEHGDLVESYEEYSATTYGKMIVLDRRMWYNDDLSAFMRIPAKLGAACARNTDDVVYALLTSASGVGPTMNEDSTALFATTGHDTANYFTGTTAATTSELSDVGISIAKKLLRKMTGPDGEYLNIQPRILLVPPELEQTALKLVQSSEIMVAGGASADVYLPTKNVHQGSMRVVVEPRLSDATNGTTAWYLVGDTMQAESIVRVYLNGRQTPYLEQVTLDADQLGAGWRVYYDFGAAALDYRGIVRGKGA